LGRDVAGAHADIGHLIAGLQLEAADHLGGVFLAFALGALEPARGLMPHHMGDLPTQIKFADALDVGSKQLLIQRVGVGQSHRPEWRGLRRFVLRVCGER